MFPCGQVTSKAAPLSYGSISKDINTKFDTFDWRYRQRYVTMTRVLRDTFFDSPLAGIILEFRTNITITYDLCFSLA